MWWGNHRDSCRHHALRNTWAEITTWSRDVADVGGARRVRVYKVQCTACSQQWTGYVGKHGDLVNVGR